MQPFSSEQIDKLYPPMLRFAKIQLKDDALAEDMVQEALTTAWHKQEQFQAASSLKTWVLSILKNKITDHFRQTPPTTPSETLQEENDALDNIHRNYFDSGGHWKKNHQPQEWRGIPDEYIEHQHFFRALEECLSRLPEDTARIFYLREIDGWDTKEICQEFQLSKENCYVILHRARNALRLCLQHNWFNDSSEYSHPQKSTTK